MNPKLRKMLEANGLRKDATEQEAWAKYDEMKNRGFDFEGIEIGTRSAATVPAGDSDGDGQRQQPGPDPVPAAQPAQGQRTYTQEDLENARAAERVRALAVDSARRNEIKDVLKVAGLTDHNNGDFARSLLENPECSVDQARKMIFEELKKRNPAFGASAHGVITVGVESGDKLRMAMTDGLARRFGVAVEKPAAGSDEFRHRSVLGMMEDIVEFHGENTRGMTRRQIAERGMTYMSTSDFGSIFIDAGSRRLLQMYMEAPSVWRAFCDVVEAADFRDQHAVSLSGSPDLMPLGENGEYKSASFSDKGEKYAVEDRGRIASITRQMVINDDLRAFERLIRLFALAARRMEMQMVFNKLLSNPTMSDGKKLFSSEHNNIGTAAILSSSSLGAARSAMRKQKGMANEILEVMAEILLTSSDDETQAEVILRSTSLPESQMSAGVFNPLAGKLNPVSTAYIESGFYLFASPSQYPVFEAAYLQGEEQPFIDERIEFKSDSLDIKVRHTFGVGIVDHVGAYYVPAP